MAPGYACLGMGIVEDELWQICSQKPVVWSRYIDDIWVFGPTSQIRSKNFMRIHNNLYPGCVVSTCLPGMTHKGCSCQQLCDDPMGMTGCGTDCVEICEPDGCFVSEKGAFILNGESFIDVSCTENCTCIDNQLSCNRYYECSPDATCKEKNGERKCHCNEGYEGDGETCNALYTDCYDAYQAGERQDGVYTILPAGWPGSPFDVSCDMTTAGGGWTRRTDGLTDFYRDWDDYKHGFGMVEQGHDLWLGNEKIYTLTNQAVYKLRVDIRTSSNSHLYAEYSSFRIGDENSKYQLSVTGYSGNAGNSLNSCNKGGKFSTRDQDNDGCSVQDFAEGHRGTWWYNTAACSHLCTECYYSYTHCNYFETRSSCNNLGTGSNLNGDYNGGNGENIFWNGYNYCNLNFAEMKIRPSSV
ncbi:Fibrinogen C domain-containing protein 1-A [Holothuria leucospilota]|uniref:Fibrinogen C domain-containing protein 1-A n=1 Tax=Holothuria leucospilota TaxID=206669 RepID=A0A9Q1CT03_HOLLE|nr:Fibrinogen C domain-containing protein 1-A [Holothuria leucospilota]